MFFKIAHCWILHEHCMVGLGRVVCGTVGEDLEGEDGRLGQKTQG